VEESGNGLNRNVSDIRRQDAFIHHLRALYMCQLTDRDRKATASIQKRRQPCKAEHYRIQTHISDRSERVTT